MYAGATDACGPECGLTSAAWTGGNLTTLTFDIDGDILIGFDVDDVKTILGI